MPKPASPFFLKFCLVPAIALVSLLQINAQAKPFMNKKVGIYFSKKNFYFDEHYNIPFTQWLNSERPERKDIQDLKSEVLVLLGEWLTNEIRDSLGADSVWFVNGNPGAAREIANAGGNCLFSDAGFHGTDLVIIVNSISLGHYKTAAVYSRSNRIITEQVLNRTGRLEIEIFRPANASLFFKGTSCIQEGDLGKTQKLVELTTSDSPTGEFFSEIFSRAFSPLCGLPEYPCPQN